MSEYDVCSICLNNITDPKDMYILEPCKHVFHNSCIINSLRKCGPRCPNCRGLDPMIKNKFNEDLYPFLDTNLNQYDSYNPPNDDDSDEDVLVRVSRYGQPFETVLRRSDISQNFISDDETEIYTSSNLIINEEVIDLTSDIIDLSNTD